MASDPLSGVPLGVPPEDYASFINAQRQSQLAQALMQGAMTPLSSPETQSVRGVYVQPRIGAVSAASKIAEALMGRSATQKAIQSQVQMARMLNQAYAPGGQPVSDGTPLQQAPDSAGSNTDATNQGVQPLINRPNGQSLDQTVHNTQPTFSPQNPRNPWGLPADVARNLAMTDPKAYAQMLQGPEAVQLGRIAGLNSQQAAQAAFAKQTAIEQRPGATIIDPVTGRRMVGADPSRGEYYVTGADGSVTALPIQNDATLQAWRAGLTTAQQQQNTPREIPMGGGVTRLGYPPAPPALGGTVGPSGAPAAPQPPVQPQPGGPGAASPQPAPMGSPVPGARPAPAPRAPAAPQAQGAWSTVPKLQVPNSPGQTSNDFQTGVLKDAAAKHAELVNSYGQQAATADQQLQYNAQALRALPNAEVGPMSEWLTTNRARLIEAGVPQSLIPGSGESVTPTLELNKYLKNAALQGARSIYGARMTQNEVNLQTEEMSPSPHMTRDAIASLIKQGNIQAQYQKQRASDYNQYRSMGGDPMQFESWYAQHRPLSRFAAQQTTPTTPGKDGLTPLQRLQAHPETLPQFKATFGWDPTQ
jgi:hypothetical protein